jgi:hemerythrin-like metal-binding protein
MPLMEWDESMSVGVATLDAEHQHLVSLINQLFDAMQQGVGRAKLGEIIDSLIVYTDTHFKHEEELFERTGYPDAEAHKREHENLRKQVLQMFRKYRFENSPILPLEALSFLKTWLINHTTGSDKRYKRHFTAHGIK